MDLKYKKIPSEYIKKILQFADIANVLKKNQVKITQHDLSLYHKQVKKIKTWIISILNHFMNNHKNFEITLTSRNGQPIYISITILGDKFTRYFTIQIYSTRPTGGYNEDLSSEPFSLDKEFRIFDDPSLSKPCYPLLKIFDILLTNYQIDYNRQENLFEFLSEDINYLEVCKDLHLRKPNFKKIDAYILSDNERKFLDLIRHLFRTFHENQNDDKVSLSDLKNRFPNNEF